MGGHFFPSIRESQRGMTLIEMAVVVVLFVVVFSAIWQTFGNASTVIRTSIWETDLDTGMRKVIVRMTEELVDTGTDTDGTDYVTSHPSTATTSISSVTFQKRIALTGDPLIDWSTSISFALGDAPGEISGNAVDDDEDGLVDEQALVRSQNGVDWLLVDGVTALTVTRNIGENYITIQLTMARPGNPGMPPLFRSMTTSIAFRNR